MAVYVEQRTLARERGAKVIGSLPAFSPVLHHLIADLGNENICYGKLADWIEKDTVLAGNVLRLVNSGLYGRRSTISSVRSAVAVLGINKLRNLVLGMSVSRLWDPRKVGAGFSTARFNLHSLATAILSDQLAMNIDVDFPEGAFLAGLFHDLGKMLIAVGMPDDHNQIQHLYKDSEVTLRECEMDVLGLCHEELSAVAAASWNLPPPIQTAVLFHHRPEPVNSKGLIPLSLVVAVANHHVNAIGKGVTGTRKAIEQEKSGDYGLNTLPLDEQGTEIVLQNFSLEFNSVAPFFS